MDLRGKQLKDSYNNILTLGENGDIEDGHGNPVLQSFITERRRVNLTNGNPYTIIEYTADLKQSGFVFGFDVGGANGAFSFQYDVYGYNGNPLVNLNKFLESVATVSVDGNKNIVANNLFGGSGSSRTFDIIIRKVGNQL